MRHGGDVSCSVRQAGVGARRGCRSVGGRGRRPRLRVHRRPPAHPGLVPCGMRSRPNGRARIHKPAKVTPPMPEGAIPRRRLFAELDASGAGRARCGSPASRGRARRRSSRPGSPLAGRSGSGCGWTPPTPSSPRSSTTSPSPYTRPPASACRSGAHAGVPAEPGRVCPRFFRRLSERLRPGTVIVLDDCHAVPPDGAFFGALRAGLEELAPGISIVLVARGDPPAALARARAHRELAVLPARALSSLRPRRWPSLAPGDRRRGDRTSRRCGAP